MMEGTLRCKFQVPIIAMKEDWNPFAQLDDAQAENESIWRSIQHLL